MRLKLDENVTVAAGHVLEQFGHDVHSVHDEGLVGATDVELMQVCKTEGRMLVTFDVGFGDLRAHQPGSHPGVVLLRLADQQPEAVLSVLRRLTRRVLRRLTRRPRSQRSRRVSGGR